MKRPVAALHLPDVAPGVPPTPPPVYMLVKPVELLIDESYQRDLSDASIRLIRRMVEGWDWRKYKAPTVAMTDEGPIVLDGQHTAIGAASHPAIDEIPVLVVEATEQRDQARAFVGINRDRLGTSATQLHHANVAAGDEAALAIDRVCVAAGIRVLRLPPSRAIYKPSETVAVAAIGALVGRRGEDGAADVLRILAGAGYGPVQAAHIRAVEELIYSAEFQEEMLPGEIGRVIGAIGIDTAEKDAKAFAATHCVPLWRGLAAVLFKSRKTARRRVLESPEGSPPPDASKSVADQPLALANPQARPGQSTTSAAAERAQRHADAVEAARVAVPAPNFSSRKP